MADETGPDTQFRDALNMTAPQLEKWLEIDASQNGGPEVAGGRESVGHDCGRRIRKIPHTPGAR